MYEKVLRRTKAVFSSRLDPLRKQESHENKGCMNSCRQSLTKPLITGFVKSKRYHRRAIKLFVFFICTAGFFYQTWTFLEIYLAYPTSQDTSEDYPEEIAAPAITICNNNRLLRQRLCKLTPENCNWDPIASWDEFCEQHRRWCYYNGSNWSTFDDFRFAWPLYNGEFKKDRSNWILNLIGPQNETDLIDRCIITNGGWYAVGGCNSSIMIQAPKDGYPHRCFSLFSLLGKPKEKSIMLLSSHTYEVYTSLHPEEYINDNDLVQASVVLHDPRKLVNPMTEGITLKGGRRYDLYLTMKTKVSLPPPYASKCEDYLKEWKKNGGYGPLSKMDCINVCLMKAMISKSGCVEQEITYPNNFTICKSQDIDAESKMLKNCSSTCGDACEENSYSFTSQVITDYSITNGDPKNERFQTDKLIIAVHFNRMTIQKFQHIPRFESIELFSYIGGYLGLWLGIALATLFDLSEMIYDTVYPFLKRKREKKTTKPTEKFRHETV